MKKKKQLSVLVPMAEGFEESEAVVVIDLLRRAEIAVTLAALNSIEVTSARNLKIVCDTILSDLDTTKFDGVVLPGGQPGTKNLMKDIRLRDVIVEFDRQNKLVAAICAAPTVLYAAGILTGRAVTSYPSVADQFDGCRYLEESVVKDGNVITSRGVGTTIPFGLALIEYLIDAEKARSIRQVIIA